MEPYSLFVYHAARKSPCSRVSAGNASEEDTQSLEQSECANSAEPQPASITGSGRTDRSTSYPQPGRGKLVHMCGREGQACVLTESRPSSDPLSGGKQHTIFYMFWIFFSLQIQDPAIWKNLTWGFTGCFLGAHTPGVCFGQCTLDDSKRAERARKDWR